MAEPYFKVINVRDYGATGDGSTDDTTFFDNAMAAAVSGGLPVYVPPGTYRVGTLLNWGADTTNPTNNPVVMMGATKAGSVLLSHSGGTVIEITGRAAVNMEVRDLTIKGVTPGTGHGIHIHHNTQDPNRLVFSNLRIMNFGGNGVRIDGPEPNADVFSSVFDEIEIDGCGDHAFYAQFVSPALSLSNILVRTVASGKVAFRIMRGQVTLLNCSGVGTPLVNGQGDWAIFGGQLAAGDPVAGEVSANLINCNIQRWQDTAITTRSGSVVVVQNCRFDPQNAVGRRVIALKLDFTALGLAQNLILPGTTFIAAPGGWKGPGPNPTQYQPIHLASNIAVPLAYGTSPTQTHLIDPFNVAREIPTVDEVLRLVGATADGFGLTVSEILGYKMGGRGVGFGSAQPGGPGVSGVRGDRVFNIDPGPAPKTPWIGWVCTASGSPGTWNKFGELSSS